MRNAREQANEARARAFILRRDAQGQRELQELKLREHGDHMQEQAARIHEHAERLSTDSRDRALEMQKLEERLAKLRELGENDRLFRAAPNGRAFIIERDGESQGQADDGLRKMNDELQMALKHIQKDRDDLRESNQRLEKRVLELEHALQVLTQRMEEQNKDRTR